MARMHHQRIHPGSGNVRLRLYPLGDPSGILSDTQDILFFRQKCPPECRISRLKAVNFKVKESTIKIQKEVLWSKFPGIVTSAQTIVENSTPPGAELEIAGPQ